MDEKKFKFRKLLLLYLFIFAVTIALVSPAHLFPIPYFMFLRFPHYLEMMPPFLGFSWPTTFEIYHYILYSLVIIGSFNLMGIIFYPKLKQIATISSLIGLFLIPLMILFFFFIFISVNASTSIIYGFYSVTLLIVDWLTFKAFIKRTREAPEAS